MRKNIETFLLGMLLASPAIYFISKFDSKILQFIFGLIAGCTATTIVIYWRNR